MKPICEDMKQASASEQAELAYLKIVKSTACCEQSSQKLKFKLSYAGFKDEAIDISLKRVKDLGIVDDERYCNMLLRKKFKSRNKAYAILFEIRQFGFEPEELDDYGYFSDRLKALSNKERSF